MDKCFINVFLGGIALPFTYIDTLSVPAAQLTLGQ
jgi:hypothetical protein